MKKIIWSTLAGWITLFVLSFILYALILPSIVPGSDPVNNEVLRGQPVFLSLIAGHLMFSLIFTLIIYDWISTKSFLNGLRVGSIMGLLFGLGVALELHGASHFYGSAAEIIGDVIMQIIRFGLTGGVIGLVLRKF